MIGDPPDSLPLSDALRLATATVHRTVEQQPFVKNLLKGALSRAVYGRFVGCLLAIYEALEHGLTCHSTHPACAGLMIPGLARVPALRADLADWQGQREDSALARRIADLAQNYPAGLVAYYYLRYFGDLSGGQMLAQALRQMKGGSSGLGLRFYDFSALGTVAEAKKLLRDRLNAVVLRQQERQAVLDEAVRGFQLHAELFDSLMKSEETSAEDAKKNLRILLVEDADMIAQVMEFLVEKAGAEFLRATNGEEGVAIAKHRHPDLILMDLQMPVMDGIEATRQIRQQEEIAPNGRRSLIYAFTAKHVVGQDAFCLDNGFDGFISKPVSASEFFKFIADLAPRLQSASAA